MVFNFFTIFTILLLIWLSYLAVLINLNHEFCELCHMGQNLVIQEAERTVCHFYNNIVSKSAVIFLKDRTFWGLIIKFFGHVESDKRSHSSEKHIVYNSGKEVGNVYSLSSAIVCPVMFLKRSIRSTHTHTYI